jgi:protein-S-isoprenylcysteine O-methyltransferase Ste14
MPILKTGAIASNAFDACCSVNSGVRHDSSDQPEPSVPDCRTPIRRLRVPEAYDLIGWAWIATLIVWVVSSFSNKRSVRRQGLQYRAVQIFLAVVAGLAIWGGGPLKSVVGPQVIPHGAYTLGTALVLTLAGLSFALWARFMLGKNWSAMVTVKEHHKLVCTGPYAIVRHPIYSGFLFALAGAVLARGTVGSIGGLILVLIVVRMKLHIEEQFMVEQFGSQYRIYCDKVKGLVPHIW